MKALTIRQTLVPNSLWDYIYDWCDTCQACGDTLYGPSLPGGPDFSGLLREMDRLHYP